MKEFTEWYPETDWNTSLNPYKDIAEIYAINGGMCEYCHAYLQGGFDVCSQCDEEIENFIASAKYHTFVSSKTWYPSQERVCDCEVSDGVESPMSCPYHGGLAWIFDKQEAGRVWQILSNMGFDPRLNESMSRFLGFLPREHLAVLDWLRQCFQEYQLLSTVLGLPTLADEEISLSLTRSEWDTHFNFTLAPSFWRMDSGSDSTRCPFGPILNLEGPVAIPTSMTFLPESTHNVAERFHRATLSSAFYVCLDSVLKEGLSLWGKDFLVQKTESCRSRWKSRPGARRLSHDTTSPSMISYWNQKIDSEIVQKKDGTLMFGDAFHKSRDKSSGYQAHIWVDPSAQRNRAATTARPQSRRSSRRKS